MTTTHDLEMEALKLLSILDEQDWIVDENTWARVEGLLESMGDKALALRAVKKRSESEAELIRVELDILKRRLAALTNTVERVKELGLQLLRAEKELTGEGRIRRYGRAVLYLGKTVAVDGPEDEYLWPAEYRYATWHADRGRARDALKNGAEIEGLSLVEREHAVFK